MAASCPVWGHGYCKRNDDNAHHCKETGPHLMHKCKCGSKRR